MEIILFFVDKKTKWLKHPDPSWKEHSMCNMWLNVDDWNKRHLNT